MMCPRCGEDNPAGAGSCARCGLPFPADGSPPVAPSGYVLPPEPSGAPAAEPAPSRSRPLASTIFLALGATAALVYAIWALTLRRGAFAGYHSKTVGQLETNDRTDTVLLVVCGLLLLAGLAIWLTTRPGSATVLDICALTALGLAAVAAGVGTYFLLTWDTDADRAVIGTVALGGGFTLAAVALLLGLASAPGLGARQ